MFLFCKPIFFSGNCRICRDLAFGSRSTFRPRFTFSLTFASGGRLSYEAYNVFAFLIYTCITFTFIFINLYLYIYIYIQLHFKIICLTSDVFLFDFLPRSKLFMFFFSNMTI